jgi:biopolymer transport protein ExbD
MAKKNQSKQKKINVRVDFTPMVDMLMLLITFFMLCTTLSKPSSMDLFLPSKDKPQDQENQQETKADRTFTIYVTASEDKLYYGIGIPDYNNPEWLQETDWSDEGIRDAIRNHRLQEDNSFPVRKIMRAVEALERDRRDHPENYNDSTFDARMAEIKKGQLSESEKVHPLTVIIKISDNATYQHMIDALNEMQILSIGTYVIDNINPQDEKMLTEKNIEM